MKEILKSKSTRLIAAFMAVVMIAAMLPATAFAWSAEEGTECTSKKGERYVGSDDAYFYSKAGNVMFYDDDGSFHIEHRNGGKAKRKYLMVDDSGSEHHVYCVEAGIDYPNNDAYSSTSGKNSRYFQNLPATAQYGIMLALMYGWHEGMNSPVSGTNNDDFAFATQVIIWEYQQQLRTSPTHLAANNGIDADKYNHTIIGRPAEQCYNWILDQMSKHCVVPSFASRSQGDAKTYTMKYDAGKSEYSITLTDTNNTLADIKFSANGITVSRNENRYTFTSKNMITDAVMISAQKKTNLGMGSMLIWGCPGKQTMASGAEDPVFFYLKLKTEAKGVGQIVKTSEDGSVEGIKFTIKGNGVNETVTTGKDGTVDLDLLPGVYTVTEQSLDVYEPQEAQTITIVSGKTSTVTFNNKLRRGDLKVTKTAEDGLVAGLQFHLYGTAACGLPVDEYAVTDAKGIAWFHDILIGSHYVLEEVGTPNQYVIPDSQSVVIEWNTVTEIGVSNRLIYGSIKGYKIDRETGESIRGALFGLFRVDETDFTEDTALLTAESDAEGVFLFSDIVYGNYLVRELRPAAGYLENDTVYKATVDKDGCVIEITVTNDMIPEIETSASVDGEKKVYATEVFTLTDTVSYKHLIPGNQYTVTGILMDKSTGAPFLQNGEQITSEVTFIPESSSGSVDVLFTFDAKLIKTNTQIVVFESIYSEGVELAVHADIDDEQQTVTVYVPEIKTIASVGGKKTIATAGMVTVEDTVSYTDLIPGVEYTLRGVLMNKSTGKEFAINGKTIAAEVKFTPENRTGKVKVIFTFDAHDLTSGVKLVAFERLYREDTEIAVHTDIQDKDQTVTITPPPDVPQTGDNSSLGVWIGLGGVALGGAIACIIMYLKKRKENGDD